MASITQINGKYRALVRRKGHKDISRYFDTRREAEAWGRKVDADIDAGRAVVQSDRVTVAKLIEEYRRIRLEVGRPVSPESNQHYMLEHLSDDLGAETVPDLTPDRFVSWARMRQEQGAGGHTVNMELSQLGTVLRHTASFMRLTIPDVVGTARPMLHYLQLIGGGKRRTRVASDDELTRLLDLLDERQPLVAEAVRVAAVTGLRRGEIARIRWDDLSEKKRAILVRQRKHPRSVEARDEWVPLLGEALEVVMRLPRSDERIFPLTLERLTDSVTEACKELGIPNLHLHDLRRNAASKLRELGFDQHERKAITGHRSDEAHEIYISVTTESLHRKYDAATQDVPPGRKRPQKDRARQP